MALMLAIAVAMQATVPDHWEMGGGQSWIGPPGGAYCQPYKRSCIDPTIRETRRWKNPDRRELSRIEAKARRGDVRAMRMFGLAKLNGYAVTKDEAAGLGWIYEAAIRGDPISMYVLGRAFDQGVGVDPDPKLAAFWLRKAAERGMPPDKSKKP